MNRLQKMIKKIFLFVIYSTLLVARSVQVAAQPPAQTQAPSQAPEPYWQQQADFDIRVTLNDNNHSLRGFETIRYTNHSPDTLSLSGSMLPNAYKDHTTALYQHWHRLKNDGANCRR